MAVAFLFVLFMVMRGNVLAAPSDDLIITAVYDGPLTGGLPKGVELYVVNDIPDLSIYGLGSANNGGGSDGQEFTFPADSAAAGSFIYVASEAAEFTNFFGFAPDYTSGAMSINGDDAIELFTSGSVSDVFGDINTDGTGQPWEYLDGWAYRVSGTGPDGAAFTLANWTFSGPNALDGETSNSTAATPVPIGTYAPPGFSISKSAPAAVDPGDLYTYTLTVNNQLGLDLTNLVITDVLPVSVTFAYASDGGALYGNVISWTAPSLANGASLSRTFAVTAAAAGGVDVVNNAYGVYAANWLTPTLGAPVTTTVSTNACGAVYTPVYDIQGSGTASPLAGQTVSTEGVVTAVYQDANQLNGFFVQDAAGDGDPATSDGVFVYTNTPAAIGDKVRVAGQVTEYFDLTEINNVTSVLNCGTGAITATAVSLPIADLADWEQYEGMLLEFPQGLYATESYNLGRYGQVSLSVADRLYNPTNVVSPGQPALDRQDLNDRSRVLLDDTYTDQNRDPIVYPPPKLTYTDTLRADDFITNLTGVLDYAFGDYRIQPVGSVDFAPRNPRPDTPPDVGGDIRAASFNVLNYFNGDGQGGGFPTSRGADSSSEFNRQRDKIISAIVALDADVIGLMELENDYNDGSLSAVQDLVNGLNAAAGAGTYAFVDPGGNIGLDEIAVGLLYKPAKVTPAGLPVILDSSVDATFNDDKNRPALTQAFTDTVSGKVFVVAVNHLKSKGSPCDDVGDPDTGDGQGNCNLTRQAAAEALVNWLATDPTGTGSNYNLIIGDLNSYAMEDPITAIKDAGYTDLLADFAGPDAYTFVFYGQFGYLDHALASDSLRPFVTGAAAWHINADEPRALDYNEEFKTANQIAELYGNGPYRASDHDPVVVGLSFQRLIYLPVVFSGN